jgi:hypothetical protein
LFIILFLSLSKINLRLMHVLEFSVACTPEAKWISYKRDGSDFISFIVIFFSPPPIISIYKPYSSGNSENKREKVEKLNTCAWRVLLRHTLLRKMSLRMSRLLMHTCSISRLFLALLPLQASLAAIYLKMCLSIHSPFPTNHTCSCRARETNSRRKNVWKFAFLLHVNNFFKFFLKNSQKIM